MAIAWFAIAAIVTVQGTAGTSSCCGKAASQACDVVAQGKGVQITRTDLEKAEIAFLAQMGVKRDAVPKERLASLQKSILQGLVSEALLLQVANHTKIQGVDSKIQAEIAKLQSRFKDEAAFHEQLAKAGLTLDQVKETLGQQIRMQEAIAAHVPKVTDPSAGDVEKYYNDHKAAFAQPSAIRASHVLTLVPKDSTSEVKAQKKKTIEAARARVIKGEDFAAVAKEVSDDKASAVQGGDLGFFAQGEMVPEFDQAAAKTKKGEVSPVFETPYGFHFVKVIDIKPASTASLDEVRSHIAEYLKERESAAGMQNYLKQLEKEAGITYSLATTESTDTSPGGDT